MAAGLPDLIDCKHLAGEGVALAREYALRDLPRLKDLLVADGGIVRAGFAFSQLASGRAAATVTVDAEPSMICQRCGQPVALAVHSSGELEFVATEDEELDAEREPYLMKNGLVSLRELAEEEVLMALPAAATCGAPQDCAHAARDARGAQQVDPALATRRPFAGLKDLLKRT